MKKILKFIIVTIVFALVNVVTISAQNVNIPDPIFKAYLVGNLAINTNADSEIQMSEANAFTDTDRKSTRLNSSHIQKSRMPSSA